MTNFIRQNTNPYATLKQTTYLNTGLYYVDISGVSSHFIGLRIDQS
jgi:hypothetical protein